MYERPLSKLSFYISESRLVEKPVERLMEFGKRRERSVKYLVAEAILQYLKEESGL